MINPYKPKFDLTPVAPDRAVFTPEGEKSEGKLITVITPFFNAGERFLESALSLRQQTYQCFNWIIVDDASELSPELDRIFLEASDLLPDSHIIRMTRNSGPGAARNVGFQNATTPYCFLLDADDLIEPTTLEKCLWYLVSNPTRSFVSGYEVGFGANTYLNTRGFDSKEEFRDENLKNPISLIRRDDFLKIGGYDPYVRGGLEDWELWLKFAENGFWGGTIPEFLNWYRWSPNQHLKWSNWASEEKVNQFRDYLTNKYQIAYSLPFSFTKTRSADSADLSVIKNPLKTSSNRRVLISDSTLDVDEVPDLSTVVFTEIPENSVEQKVYKKTSDVFVLPRFLTQANFQVFIDYIKESRNAF